jgi:hypothetical protein
MSQLELKFRSSGPTPVTLAIWWSGLSQWLLPWRAGIAVAAPRHRSGDRPDPLMARTFGWYAAPVRVSRELWSSDDRSGVGYRATAPDPAAPHLLCGIEASVVPCLGWKPAAWLAEMRLDLPGRAGASWSATRTFATREEAAREAADAVAHAEVLLSRALRGEAVITPGQRREAAAQAAADVDAECLRAAEQVRAAEEAYGALGAGAPGWQAARVDLGQARTRAQIVRRRFVQSVHDAHDWRGFA